MMDREVLFVGGAFLFAPMVACVLGIALFKLGLGPLWYIAIPSLIGMAVYAGGCMLHAQYKRTLEDNANTV